MPYMDGKGQVSPVLRFFWCTATGTRKVSRWMSCSPLGQTATPMVGTRAIFIGLSTSVKGFLHLSLHAFGHLFAISSFILWKDLTRFSLLWHVGAPPCSRVNDTSFGAVDAPASWYMTWAMTAMTPQFFSSIAGADPVIYSTYSTSWGCS